MSSPPESFTVGSLYIAGFAQARAPHLGLIIPTDSKTGHLIHIRVDRATSPHWAYQCRTEKIEGNMFLSCLLKLHDVAAGEITVSQLQIAAKLVPVPENDNFGECGPWVYRVVEELHNLGLIALVDAQELAKEFNAFAAESKAFARRDRFPNLAVSLYCS